MRNCLLCAAALALSPLASAQQPNAATPRSIKWIDATQLPVEGRPFFSRHSFRSGQDGFLFHSRFLRGMMKMDSLSPQ